VTPLFSVKEVGITYFRGKDQTVQTIQVTNTSKSTVQGPISLVVANKDPSDKLVNLDGRTPPGVVPEDGDIRRSYVTLVASSSDSLKPGQSAVVKLIYSGFLRPDPATNYLICSGPPGIIPPFDH
jgi:hypothetical protein